MNKGTKAGIIWTVLVVLLVIRLLDNVYSFLTDYFGVILFVSASLCWILFAILEFDLFGDGLRS